MWDGELVSDRSPIVLDLTDVEFVCPLDLVGLVVWGSTVKESRRGSIILPQGSAATYLERMNVLPLLRAAGWDAARVGDDEREPLFHKLLEVTALKDAWAVEDLGEQLLKLFAWKNEDPRRMRALHFAFGELCDNATSHSGGSPIYVAAQRYSGQTSGAPARLELAVADNGMGIPEHLRRNPNYADVGEDDDAIAKALRPGVSGTRDRRGFGLFDVLHETSQVADGEMVVYSGSGSAVVPIGTEGRRRRFRPLRGRLPGTWIQVRVVE